jgi:lipopolysaccharide transport system ATP-binding protein
MSDVVVEVEKLGKCYQITRQHRRNDTLRDALTDGVRGFKRRISRFVSRRPNENQKPFWALRDVSFQVKQGEVLGVIGRNGAGKSTLLKLLARITEPTEGRFGLCGRVASLLEVGTGFHPELTGRENIYLNGAILGMRRAEISRRFDEIVEFSEIEQFLDTPVKRYSSGMYVRLAFAVAAHLEPEILIVDEVLAVGDAAFQEKCMGKMKRTATQGRTVLFVSHNMASIQQLCTRAFCIRSGQVVSEGNPRDVIRAYMRQNRSEHNASIRDWPDRETNGQARIVELEISDLTDGNKGSVAFGSDLQLTIGAEFHEPTVDPGFGVIIQSMDGEPLLDLRSSHSGVRLGSVSGRIDMQLTVRQLGLHPGEYLLSPWISDAVCSVDLDWVKYCAKLRVHPAPAMGRTIRLNPAYGRYWIPSSWELV